MHQFEWLSERGGNFLDLLQEERELREGRGFPQKQGGGGVPTPEETMTRSRSLDDLWDGMVSYK